ncbi:MAG: hypothetical protein ABSA76_03530 [Bacteroidales bacterium]
MEDNSKKEPVKPEDEGLLDKAKKFAEKADDFIDENVEKLKKSKTFESVTGAMDKAGNYVENKVKEAKDGKIKEKLEALADKAEAKAEEEMSKAKVAGKKLAGKAADKLEDIAGEIRKKTKDDKAPEKPA